MPTSPQKNSVIWVTGASSGIGQAVARRWIELGGRVVLSARRTDRLEKLAAELGGPERAIAIACDVTQEASCIETAQAGARHFGGLEFVFANAGFGVSGEFELLTDEDYARQFETNIFGVLRTTRAAFPHLKKTRGTLAITGSVLSHLSLPGGSPYAMSKFAVRAFAEALRAEWARHGIGVTLISPGFVASEIRQVDNSGQHHPENADPVPEWLMVPAATAAQEIISGILKRKPEAVITGHGRWLVFINRIFPGWVRTFLVPRFATPAGKKGWTRD